MSPANDSTLIQSDQKILEGKVNNYWELPSVPPVKGQSTSI